MIRSFKPDNCPGHGGVSVENKAVDALESDVTEGRLSPRQRPRCVARMGVSAHGVSCACCRTGSTTLASTSSPGNDLALPEKKAQLLEEVGPFPSFVMLGCEGRTMPLQGMSSFFPPHTA